MKTKKAFTLVELLAVIVILAVVLIIAVPGVLGIIKTQKEKAYETQLKMIKEAARLYVSSSEKQLNFKIEDTYKIAIITIEELKKEGYLDKKIVDPRNVLEIKDIQVKVLISNNGKQTLDIVHTDSSNANYPIYSTNMIPIVYKDNRWVKADATNLNQSWFDYSKQNWANIATVTEATREGYLNASVGTEIKMSDINTMFVWIPRFKYKLWNTTKLLPPTDNEFLDGDYTIHTEFEIVNESKSTGTKNGDFLTHPAFTLASEELYGFWVGKFETGYNQGDELSNYTSTGAQKNELNPNKILIKPNVYSWVGINYKNIFHNAISLRESSNTFGFNKGNDSHMIKNMEWGALTYLAYSQYGKSGNKNYTGTDREITMNSMTNAMTGCGVSITTGVCEKYQTINGIKASSTGNITGIYDTSGGSWEFVSSILMQADNIHGETSKSGFSQEELDALINENKYLDTFSYTTDWKTIAKPKLGDGTIETWPLTVVNTSEGLPYAQYGSWYSDSAVYPANKHSTLVRGGGYYDNSQKETGPFTTLHSQGSAFLTGGWRITIS